MLQCSSAATCIFELCVLFFSIKIPLKQKVVQQEVSLAWLCVPSKRFGGFCHLNHMMIILLMCSLEKMQLLYSVRKTQLKRDLCGEKSSF